MMRHQPAQKLTHTGLILRFLLNTKIRHDTNGIYLSRRALSARTEHKKATDPQNKHPDTYYQFQDRLLPIIEMLISDEQYDSQHIHVHLAFSGQYLSKDKRHEDPLYHVINIQKPGSSAKQILVCDQTNRTIFLHQGEINIQDIAGKLPSALVHDFGFHPIKKTENWLTRIKECIGRDTDPAPQRQLGHHSKRKHSILTNDDVIEACFRYLLYRQNQGFDLALTPQNTKTRNKDDMFQPMHNLYQYCTTGGRGLTDKKPMLQRIKEFIYVAADQYKQENGTYPLATSDEEIPNIPGGIQGVSWRMTAQALKALSFYGVFLNKTEMLILIGQELYEFQKQHGRLVNSSTHKGLPVDNLPGETYPSLVWALQLGGKNTPLEKHRHTMTEAINAYLNAQQQTNTLITKGPAHTM